MSTEQEYDELRDRLTRVETKLDVVLGQLTGTHADHEARIRALEHRVDPTSALTAIDTDHEARIRKLERWVWMAAGASGAAGGGLGAFLASVLGGG